ncbi:hypothetical protein ACHAWF_014605 [Thalassiosira exigua]
MTKSNAANAKLSGFAKVLGFISIACLAWFASYHFFSAGFDLNRADTKLSASLTIGVAESNTKLRGSALLKRDDPSLFMQSCEENLPACARDVFLTLHKETGEEDEDQCKGLLVSDDMIVTDKACSEFKFTFEHPVWGTVEAVPHTSFNSKEKMVGSHLGLLEARAPSSTHFMDKLSRRTLMFLSFQSTPIVDDTDPDSSSRGAPTFMTCGDNHEPIAHTFPVDGEMVPLRDLAGVVPDYVLWKENDIQSAPMLRYKTHRWWTKPVTLEEENKVIERMLEQYRGPPGSISVPDAHHKNISAIGGILEVIDPRGHRNPGCFKIYFSIYRTEVPFSNMHFFDWLDFGNGKFLLEKNPWYRKKALERRTIIDACFKKEFNKMSLNYFSEKERRKHVIDISPSRNGNELIARYRHNGKLVPESPEGEPHLYMFDLNQTLYIVDHTWNEEKKGRFKHTSLLDGAPAMSAGKAYFGERGTIWGVNFSSGHYKPQIQSAVMMYQSFKTNGLNVSALHWIGRTSWSTQSCYDVDWESIKIAEFEASELLKSCYELTKSPMWILKEDV